MIKNVFLCVLFALSSISYNACAKADTLTDAELVFEPCRIELGAMTEDGECATLRRLEDPSDPNSKVLDLFAVKFPSSNPNPKPDAFTIIQGGPGMSSIDMYMGKQNSFAQIRRQRDILLIDQRGTGRSHAFMCPMDNPETMDESPEEVTKLALECIDQFDGNAEFYTTARAVEDLDALREATGYPQLTVYGVSYGTRVGLEYLRAYPNNTRALLLDGVVAPTVNLAGSEIAVRSQQAFDRLVARCDADEACKEAHGDLRASFETVRALLIDSPASVKLIHPISGKMVDREVGESDLLGAVRLMPYSTESLALLPLMLTQAKQGQFTMLAAQAIQIEEQFASNYAIGMNNSVLCSEDFPYLTDAEREPRQDTYFAGSMIEMIKAMCDVWPRSGDYSASRTLFDSDVPVLLMSGEYDPITPPSNAEVVDEMLSNSRHVVVPAQGHGVFDRGCMAQITVNFVEQANFEEFDASCVERQIPFPLFIDTTGPQQ